MVSSARQTWTSGGALPYPCVDEHLVAEAGQQRPQRADVDRNRVAPLQSARDLPRPVGADRPHAVEFRLPVEGGVGERHPAPGRGGPWVVVDPHAVALAEQEVGDGRADVSEAADDNDDHGGSLGQAAAHHHLASRSRLSSQNVGSPAHWTPG